MGSADPYPIVSYPAPGTRTPVLVSVPHYGTQPLPHITLDDYGEPSYETFAYGFADTFVGDLYGDLHEQGATVLATPFSRMFVDVNRRRDDFEERDGEIRSRRGVVLTHTMRDVPIFALPLDCHTGIPRRMKHHQMIIGTRHDVTCHRGLAAAVAGIFTRPDFEVHEN